MKNPGVKGHVALAAMMEDRTLTYEYNAFEYRYANDELQFRNVRLTPTSLLLSWQRSHLRHRAMLEDGWVQRAPPSEG